MTDKEKIIAYIDKLLEKYPKNYYLLMVAEFIDNLEVKEIDLEKEIELVKGDYEQVEVAWNNDFDYIAKHFFELGLSVNNPITASDRGMAEEIIVNLKRVENDYHINLTKEMEWLRNKVKKGE